METEERNNEIAKNIRNYVLIILFGVVTALTGGVTGSSLSVMSKDDVKRLCKEALLEVSVLQHQRNIMNDIQIRVNELERRSGIRKLNRK